MKKQLFTAILAVSMLTPTAYAADWVYVSSWAYNDVSNFTNEGLLPDTFADVSDYRQPASLEQVCELLDSVGSSFGETLHRDDYYVFDSTYAIVHHLAALQLGEKKYIEIPESIDKNSEEAYDYLIANYAHTRYRSEDWYGHYYVDLDINAPLTRGEAALVFNDCYEWWIPFSNLGGYPAGGGYPIVDGAPDAGAVYWCKQNGVMDATSDTYGYITIEQAIVAAYRLYLAHPSVSRPDSNEDGYIQTYSNGVEEHRSGNRYILKRNGTDIAMFETDVYKNIYCTDTHDGRTLAAAEHILKHTDIYDLSTGAVVATIPYRTDSMKDNCIITKQANENGMTYGACGFDGNVFLEPCYSRLEVDTLHAAGFGAVIEEPRTAEGWLYFINEDCRLYRVDTNGENEVCMSNMRITAFQYKNGTLYCFTLNNDGEKLWAMNEDGSGVELISDDIFSFYGYDLDENINTVYKDYGEWIYYLNQDKSELWRVKRDGNGYINERVESSKELTGQVSIVSNKIKYKEEHFSDAYYKIKLIDGRALYSFEDFYTEETIVPDLGTEPVPIERYKNLLILRKSAENELIIYDMDARSTVKTLSDIDGNIKLLSSTLLCDTRFGNTARINLDTLMYEEIYPCKGIYRYGELDSIVLLGNRKPHKLMKNGFYLPLTSQTIADYALVMN